MKRMFLLMLMLLTPPVLAEVVLLDAETAEEAALWKPSTDKLRVVSSPQMATRGSHSLLVSSAGVPKEGRVSRELGVMDWSEYDRLVLDVYNAGEGGTRLRVFVDTVPDDARRYFVVPAREWLRIVYPVADMDPERADIRQVTRLSVRSSDNSAPLALYIDNVVLLKAGEAVPEAPAAFRETIRGQLVERQRALEEELSGLGDSMDTRRDKQIVKRLSQEARAGLRAVGKDLRGPLGPASMYMATSKRLDDLQRTVWRIPSITLLADAIEDEGALRGRDVLLGVASSMTKVLPRDVSVELDPVTEVGLSLARNETESFQIGVLPLRRAVRQVSCEVGDLKGNNGAVFSGDSIACDVVGYVETKGLPPYDAPAVGWWPDPLLDFTGPVDIAPGDAQTFWIRVRAPKDQPPGIYAGDVLVRGQGMRDVRVPLTVTVHSFALPGHSPMPTAITFGPPVAPFSGILDEVVATEAWNRELKFLWADFLADYLISYDHLYRPAPPDFEVIDHLRKQGRLGAFNLGYCGVGKTGEGKADPEGLRNMLSWAGEAHAKTKERGLLGHAYIYGYDEVEAEWFQAVEDTAAAVKDALPGVLFLTTTRDRSHGRDGAMPSVDAWCPTTDHYDAELAKEARGRGQQVWWYVCIGPKHPHANVFLEYPAIEARLLMGAMAAKYRPDGFLYYQISLWKASEPIRTGPFTNWNPQTWRTSHGDGSWVCMREGGLPVPTIRLENYRDGLEDYAYVRILEEAVRVRESGPGQLSGEEARWLREAKAVLNVPDELVNALDVYSRDPGILRAWRDKLATMIETSGLHDIDPWKDGFGLRMTGGRQGG